MPLTAVGGTGRNRPREKVVSVNLTALSSRRLLEIQSRDVEEAATHLRGKEETLETDIWV